MLSEVGVEDRELYRWQLDALVSWLRCGRRGVIEAVTGSGKTDVAIAATADALRRGRFVLVVVPSRVLMEQWCGRLAAALPNARIGRLGDSGTDRPAACDVLVATRHSAAAHKPVPPNGGDGLLVADECHGLGGGTLRRAMLPQYAERLGLTATLERSDDAVTELLVPYFGGVCHRYGFEQAIADGVCAPPRVAFVGVELSAGERAEYTATEHQLVGARNHLRQVRGMPLEPFGDFIAAVSHLAERDAGADGRAAREYLDAFSKRREIVAQSSGKYELLGGLAPAIRDAHGALVFTETVRAANHAINRLDPLVSIDLITGATGAATAPGDPRRPARPAPRRGRRTACARRGRRRPRREPRHRDERESHAPPDDPAHGPHPSTQATRDRGPVRHHVRQGHVGGPDPTRRARRLPRRDRTHLRGFGGLRRRALRCARHLPRGAGPRRRPRTRARRSARPTTRPRVRAGRRPRGRTTSPTSSSRWPICRRSPSPRCSHKRLSTGQAPLEIARVGSEWRIRCTGCGEASRRVKFRWQVLDETVNCRCD